MKGILCLGAASSSPPPYGSLLNCVPSVGSASGSAGEGLGGGGLGAFSFGNAPNTEPGFPKVAPPGIAVGKTLPTMNGDAAPAPGVVGIHVELDPPTGNACGLNGATAGGNAGGIGARFAKGSGEFCGCGCVSVKPGRPVACCMWYCIICICCC